jgi:protein-tyrosine phosphatase
MRSDLYWIPVPWPGRLAIAARPRGGDWLADEAIGWRRAGIDVVVSLLEEDEAAQLNLADEAQAAETENIRFISFPIPDLGVPASLRRAVSVMSEIDSALRAGKNVAIHCRQGIGRSGLIAAGVLAVAGINPDEAIRVVSSARGLSVPETDEQRLWLRRLPASPPAVVR